MKQLLIICSILYLLPGQVFSQKYFTKNGSIAFFSKTPLENITAENSQVMSVLNTQNGELNFSLLIRNFHFKKALMEDHFNESYLESDKYPNATFKGTISDPAKINFTQDGVYNIIVNGDLSIHGITHKISAPGTITIQGGKITGSSKFQVKPADYNISIPKLVKDNIAETIEVTVACSYLNKL